MEADWRLLTTCNFRCAYCFCGAPALGAKLTVYGAHDEWLEGFNATGKTWLLHITGGEPSLYPGLVGLCERLVRHHFLSINSNLSHRSMDAFAEKVNPDRVHYINAALHYDERQKRKGLNAFIERVHKLRTHGFNVLISAVMTPAMVSLFPEVSEYFESCGLFLIPKVMREKYQGRRYPAAYSAEQKSLIQRYLTRASEKYSTLIAGMGEPPTIDMLSDGRFLDGMPHYRGKLCGSGYNFVRIEPDGTVWRCGTWKRLGNVLLKDVHLLPAPRRCDSSYCPYFCEKYTSPQRVPVAAGADGSQFGPLRRLARGIRQLVEA